MTPKEDQQPMMTREELVGHMPGPWIVQHANSGVRIVQKSNATGPKAKVICSGLGGNRANARLIAAAPAMFDYIAKKAAEGDEDARALLAEYVITKRTTEG